MAHFKTNMDLVTRRRQEILRQNEERRDKEKELDLEEGTNTLRLMPPWSAEGNWRRRAFYHYRITKDAPPPVCPKETFNQPCPICDEVVRLFQHAKEKNDKEAKELAFDIRAKERFFVNALSYDPKHGGKVKILAIGKKIEQKITFLMTGGGGTAEEQAAAAAAGFTGGLGDITDVQTGRAIQITKKALNPQDKKQVEYDVIAAPSAGPLPNAEAYLAQLHNLDEFVMKDVLTYDQLVALLNGQSVTPAPSSAAGAPPPPPAFTQPALPAAPPAPPVQGKIDAGFTAPPSGFPASPTLPPPPAAQAAPPPAAPPAQSAPTALDRLKAMQARSAAGAPK